ncbi:hypothetical protein [Caulobacter sp. 17J65-9]|uniref:hypothetical protein n=1 Tax=Caulobacter sp. 17J65-9 TaxID=2709382 RepID=UPI0013CCCC7F|nr:hypothetical protein [Caulobacter sp. 17J65-9]NEX93192.1 hypothetical protein [Caulobacter sp. 17J65-9]
MNWKTTGAATLAAALGTSAALAQEDPTRVMMIEGAPGLMLYAAPSYLPDGKPVDQIYVINHSKQRYCVRLEIAMQKFVHADHKVVVTASAPGVNMRINQVKFLMPKSSYLPKYRATPLPDGESWSWCKQALKQMPPEKTPGKTPETAPAAPGA